MEIKTVGIPVVKPVGGATPTPVTVKPVGAVAPVVTAPVAVKPIQPVVAPAQTAPVTTPVVEEEKPVGGLFGGPSVADTPKEERLADVKNAVNKVDNKKSKTTKADEDSDEDDEDKEPKKKEPKFKVPLKVRIYDREVFIVDDINTTEDQIRLKAVDEYGFFEFDKERTKFIYNKDKNEVVLKASFEKRG